MFGAAGGLARAGLAELPAAWPWPTLTANLIGTFLLGFVVRFGAHRWPMWLRVAAAVGALGALTTFSTLAAEVWTLADAADWAGVSTYLLATLSGGLAAAVAGLRMGEAVR